jgi:hypothetical protein
MTASQPDSPIMLTMMSSSSRTWQPAAAAAVAVAVGGAEGVLLYKQLMKMR